MVNKKKNKEYNLKHRHSKKGLIGTIYARQKASSKERGHLAPSYTLDELREAVIPMELFDELFNAWVESNYNKWLAPSLDRIDDYKPYTEDNIQLMTWQENNNKYHLDHREGRNNKDSKVVEQFTKKEEYVATYHSTHEAHRITGTAQSSISDCCKGKRNSAGGFKWQYVEVK